MPRVIAILNQSRRIADRIGSARLVAERLAADPIFASPPLSLAVFEADIAALDAAQVHTLTRAMGAAATRDSKLAKVRSDLGILRIYVQRLADGSQAGAAI